MDEATAPRPTVDLLGTRITAIRERDVLDLVVHALDGGRGGWIVTVNVDALRTVTRNPEVRALVDRADLVVADGMPLVWASALRRKPVPERVAGSSMIWSLSARAAAAGHSIFLLGGEPGVADAAAGRLATAYPDLTIAGTLSPPHGFEHDESAVEAIVERVRAGDPAIVYVGLGFPKQERLIERLRAELPSVWFLGVGISIGFVGGQVRRAPPWMQRAGLEWVHRLVQEPSRLASRYLVRDIPFALRLLASSAASRRR